MALSAGQVTVDGTSGGVLIYTATQYVNLNIKNTNATSTNTAVLGATGVTTTTGYVLAGLEAAVVRLGPGQSLYGIRGTLNSVVVSYLANS